MELEIRVKLKNLTQYQKLVYLICINDNCANFAFGEKVLNNEYDVLRLIFSTNDHGFFVTSSGVSDSTNLKSFEELVETFIQYYTVHKKVHSIRTCTFSIKEISKKNIAVLLKVLIAKI